MESVKDIYTSKAIPELVKKFDYKSSFHAPKIKKVVLNVGMGEAVQNSKLIEGAVYGLTQISGQKPVVTKAKKSIAAYKLREGMPIGCMVTLRKERMYSFLDRLINIALPRVRDFRGVSPRGFDGRGNFTMGLAEVIAFPEVNIDEIQKMYGMNISIVTSAGSNDEARFLLEQIGMPFRK